MRPYSLLGTLLPDVYSYGVAKAQDWAAVFPGIPECNRQKKMDVLVMEHVHREAMHGELKCGFYMHHEVKTESNTVVFIDLYKWNSADFYSLLIHEKIIKEKVV